MTIRYAQVALQNWEDLDGYAVGHGMRSPKSLPVDRFCHWIWWMLTRNSEKQEREKLRAKIWQPPMNSTAPIDKRSPWSPENEGKAFAMLKQQLAPSGPKEIPPEG